MTSTNDDILILTEKDLCFYDAKTCCGTTLKGKSCKNKVYQNYDYCKTHYEKFRLEKPDECPVCMESLNDVKVPLSCSHWVHRKCILNWGKSNCPVCRAEIKLTANERKKMYKKSIKHNDNDIVLPQQLIEFMEALIYSFPEAIRDEFTFNVDVQDNSITLINEYDDTDTLFNSLDVD